MDSQACGMFPNLPSRHFARQDPHSIAANLPLDIFVDDLSPHLRFEDVMALRRVNKHYFCLTHEPLIWKRFLQQLKIPFPPIRPTFKYSAQSTDYEIEQLVSRSISIEDNWRKKRPVVASTMSFDASLEVLDMKIIPGGKYLVASMGNDSSFSITVFHLDHPTTPQALLSYPIQGKPYQLQAKYMKYHSRPVIMIAYVCQVLPEDGSTNDPPSDSHVLNCIHVKLGALDILADDHRDPARLRILSKLWPSLDNQLRKVQHTIRQPVMPTTQLSLYSRDSVAYVSIIVEATSDAPDCLVIVNVENPRKLWAVLCKPYSYPHDPLRPVNPLPHMKQWIQAVRHIPEQNHVLIWRSIKIDSDGGDEESYAHGIELMTLPDQTSGNEFKYFAAVPIHGHLVLLGGNIQSVHMTDDIWPYDEGSSIYARDPSIPPPPISVFAETPDPRALYHWHIWPSLGPAASRIPYVYHPHGSTVTAQMKHSAHPYTGHVLPGVYRSLIYTTERTGGGGGGSGGGTAPASPFVSLHRYSSPRFYATTNRLAHRHHRHAERHDYLGAPSAISAAIDMGEEAAARYREHGVGVATWDQTIGRVCLTTARGSVIQVVDFSHATRPDERFLGWKMAAPGGFERKEEVEAEEAEEEEEEEESLGVPPKRKRARVA